MEFLSKAWRQVFPEDAHRTETTYNGNLLSFAEFAACRLLRVPPSTERKVRLVFPSCQQSSCTDLG